MSAIAPILQRGEIASTVTDMVTEYFPVFVDYFKETHIMSKITLIGAFGLFVVVFAIAHNFFDKLPQMLRLYAAKIFCTYERDINYKDHSNHHYSNSEESVVNKAIVRSIRLYIYRQFKDSSFQKGSVSLLDMKEPFASQDGAFRSVQSLKKMELVGFPAENVWFDVPNQTPVISLRHSMSRKVDGSNLIREMQMTLRCRAKDGDRVIKEFVNKCHKGLIQQAKDNKDRCRYFYQLQSFSTPESDTGVSVPMFKRFPISDDRDFDTMFFPEKLSITRLVDNFTNKTGKFGIEGFPHKLGLLLHGPPGTGKTTFVKSIATHLKRHIVSIPLGKIKKNQQLYDIMFEGVYHVEGDSEGPYDLDLKSVIFLMEEVDAASTVVKTRSDEPTAVKTMQVDDEDKDGDDAEEKTVPEEDDGKKEGSEDGSKTNGEEEEEGEESESEASSEEPQRPQRGVRGRGGRGRGRGRGGWSRQEGRTEKKKKGESKSLFESLDNFDLAGLLNVLDGVVDSPGRVVLMTTNHPDQLDPALIRPGRINTTLHLGFMKNRELLDMVRHHFGVEAVASFETRIKNVLQTKERASQQEERRPFRITPAEVEQLCAESDTIEEFCTALNFFPKIGTVTAAEGMKD